MPDNPIAGDEQALLLERERLARRDAECAARVRDRFLAVVSHELRTPLNSIQSWAHVLENQLDTAGRHDPVAQRALSGIRAGIAQQVQIIDDLLDTTLALSGTLEIVETRLSLGLLLAQSAERLRPAALERDVTLLSAIDIDDCVLGDERRLGRAFDHVLSNAIKFTPIGSQVRITTAREGALMVVRYLDQGAGFPAAIREALFEPFEQVDSSTTRRAGGLGIGLTLARLIIELHGGRIWIDEPADEAGCAVVIALPSMAADAGSSAGPASALSGAESLPRIEAVDILVIDDQIEAREALRALLVQFGAHVEVRDSVEAAIASIRARRRFPDAVLCDIAMPEEDGYTFLRRFRHLERDAVECQRRAHPVPVIALSAFVHAQSADEAQRFDDYLEKPVSPDRLVTGIARALSRTH